MNEIANQLVQSLFKKNSLQECSRWELEILAEHYPYFGIAQLLIASKLKEEDVQGYEKQVQKTSLYFTNPFWLDYVLNNKTHSSPETIIEEKQETNEVPEAILEEINEIETKIIHGENHSEQPVVAESIVEHADFKEEQIIEQPFLSSQHETLFPEKSEEVNEVPEAILEEINEIETKIIHGENHAEPSEVAEPIVEHAGFKEEQIIEEPFLASQHETLFPEKSEEVNEVPEAILEEINEIETKIIHGENHTEQSVVIEPIVEDGDFKEGSITASQSEVIIPEEDKADEFKIAPLKMEPLPDANTPLPFEPYHTVDYFASQGIKLSVEEKPQDRFGQQLKSFTQWLKTIKKAPPTEITNEYGKGIEQKVVTLARHSLEDREIVTETMAEVWIKQGNREKAIEVYNKLSLQNPAKSSYFASLIEQLNQH